MDGSTKPGGRWQVFLFFLVKDGKQNPENGDDLKVETRKRVVHILFLC